MRILDPCCGSRMFWFDKHEPHTTFTDIRCEKKEVKDRGHIRTVEIKPDAIADYRHLPYANLSFNLIVFDPPHLIRAGKNSWLAAKYGVLDSNDWQDNLTRAFRELWRVLALDGVLIFKWSNNQIPFKDVLNLFDQKPIFGDHKGHTRWLVFIKPNDNENSGPFLKTTVSLSKKDGLLNFVD